MPQIRALLGGTKTKLPGGLNLFWEPGVIDVEFLNGRRQEGGLSAPRRSVHLLLSRCYSRLPVQH